MNICTNFDRMCHNINQARLKKDMRYYNYWYKKLNNFDKWDKLHYSQWEALFHISMRKRNYDSENGSNEYCGWDKVAEFSLEKLNNLTPQKSLKGSYTKWHAFARILFEKLKIKEA